MSWALNNVDDLYLDIPFLFEHACCVDMYMYVISVPLTYMYLCVCVCIL